MTTQNSEYQTILTDREGIFTRMRSFILKHALRILAPDSEVTIRMRFPDEWIVCAFCGEAGWGIHPHFGNPCPITASVADSMGLKMDAERATAARMGLQMEEATKVLRKHFMGEDEE